jgi:IS5 family transposase
MLPIHFPQQWFGLLALAMEDALLGSQQYRVFAGLSSAARIPECVSFLRFRHLLEQHQYTLQILATVNSTLAAVLPASMALGMRLSGTDWVDGGWDVQQSVVFGHELKKRGCHFMHVSSAGISPLQQIPLGPNYQVPLAEQVKREVGLPTIAVGLVTEPEQAEAIIASGRADLVALARAMLFDPRWPWHAAAKLGAQVDAPPQYWRSQPRGMNQLFGDVKIGQR